MTGTRNFVTALLKVWGVVWLVSGVTGLANVIIELFTRPFASSDAAMQRFSQFSSMATVLVTLGAAIVLIKYGESISARLIHIDDEFALAVSPTQLEAALIGVLGAYLVVRGFREGAVTAYALIRRASWDPSGSIEYVWRNRESAVVGAAVDFLSGLVLMLGRKGIAETWGRLHPMGSNDKLPPSDESAAGMTDQTRQP